MMDVAKWKPTGNRLIARRKEAPTTSDGGILIPENAQRNPVNQGVVVKSALPEFPEGAEIVYTPYAGIPLEDAANPHFLIDVEDVLAIAQK